MDLLHSNHLDGCCLISSDSDFTRLATRIRESGLVVYGFGEEKTPEAFISACDKFIFTEVLKAKPQLPIQNQDTQNKLKEIVISAIKAVSKEDGWAALSGVGGYITKNNPSFDSRNYGHEKLGKLIKSLDYVVCEERKINEYVHLMSN